MRKTIVSRRAHSTILFMKHSDALILLSIFITYCTRFIRASIVNKQQLKVGEFLSQDAINASRQVLLRFIYGNNNGYFGSIHSYSILNALINLMD